MSKEAAGEAWERCLPTSCLWSFLRTACFEFWADDWANNLIVYETIML